MGKSLSVRFPDWLYVALDEDAERKERSMGGQVRYVLGLYYAKPERLAVPDWKDQFTTWLDEGQRPDYEVEGADGAMMPMEHFLISCTEATDIMPGMLCRMLDIPPGSTWGEAAMAALGRVDWEAEE